VSPNELAEGLVYVPDLLTDEEEKALLEDLEQLDFEEIRMRGQTARRTVRHFGLDYDYERWQVTPTEPLPESFEWLRERAAGLVERKSEELAEVLITRYPPGAGIGWHRDAPMFLEVIGVSLASACRMRFQRGKGSERRTFELELEPRSTYVLAGSIRWQWQHSIPATEELRYSITFRTLKG
jgi:alkylated DNA repair protein (DNA oxidative demethylase)